MRLSIFLLLCCFALSLQSQSLADKKINFKAKDLFIGDALLQLSETANCGISFNSKIFKETQRVNLDVNNKAVSYILRKCLDNTGFTFKIEKNSIRLIQLPPPVYTISGYVEDSLSGERLVAATVYDKQSGKGTISNEYGFYSLSIPKGEATLTYSYLGFRSTSYQLSIRKDLQLTVVLNPSITLGEIVVTDSKQQVNSEFNVEQAPDFTTKKLSKIPTLGGEADILRYFQTSAGVESGADGLGGMTIRGGASNQNLVLLDGVPVYNPTHSLGLFSIFNTQTIKKATLYKGSFPARYSGRLSSIVDIRTREGNAKEFHGGLDVSLLATSLFIEGPIKKDTTAYLLSIRRTHIDPLVNGLIEEERAKNNYSGRSGYYFYDVNLKLNHTFSTKDRLYLSYYQGRDDIKDKSEFRENHFDESCEEDDFCKSATFLATQTNFLNYNWGNTILALRWNHLWNNQLFSNTTLTYSEFGFTSYFGTEDYFEQSRRPTFPEDDEDDEDDESSYIIDLYKFSSNINDSGLKIDFDYLPNNQHHFRFGTGVLVREFSPSLVSNQIEEDNEFDFEGGQFEEEITLSDPLFYAAELNLYGEDDFQLSKQLKAQIGLHSVLFIAPNKIYPSLQPRLSLQYQVHKKGQLHASFSQMSQFLHVLQSNNTGIPNDLWVPSTKKVRPQTAWQIGIGTQWNLPKAFHWKLEGYYKKLNHLVTYRDDTDFLLEEEDELQFDWEAEIAKGKGWAYGLETSLTRQIGQTTGWLNYSLAWSDRQFNDVNNNQRFPFRYNRRHAIKLGLSHQFSPTFNVFTTWNYGSGQWSTLPTIQVEEDEIRLDVLQPFPIDNNTPINDYRLKDFHRLDVACNFFWPQQNVEHRLTVGLHNVYGRKNTMFAYQVEEDSKVELEEIGLGVILPSFKYSLNF